MATVLSLPVVPVLVQTKPHWDILSGLSPRESADSLLGIFQGGGFERVTSYIPGIPGVKVEIISKLTHQNILTLDVYGESVTYYIHLTVFCETVQGGDREPVVFETGIESWTPLPADREEVLETIMEVLCSVKSEH